MGFWIQYRALMFKNWILWKRKILGSLCEILLPIGAMIIIGLLRMAVPVDEQDSQTFKDQVKDAKFLAGGTKDSPFINCLYDQVSQPYGYSIISQDKDYVDFMKSKVASSIAGLNRGIEFEHVDFDSISKFEDYITGSNYEDKKKICFGVYMKSSNSRYEVRIRYNVTNPITEKGDRLGENVNIFNMDFYPPYDDLVIAPTSDLEDFYRYGFLSLMEFTNNYFLSKKSESSSMTASFYPMRFDDYSEDYFLIGLGYTLVFFLEFSFMIPALRMLSAIVQDKETRTKEIMMMMGLKGSAYWCSWISFYFIVYTFNCVVITIIITGMNVFTYSNPGLIFLYFWLFGLSCLAFSVLMSTFFSKSRSAVLVGIPIFLGSYFVGFAVDDPLMSTNEKAGTALLPCVAFSLGTKVITSLETGQMGMNVDNPEYLVGNFSHGLYFAMILIDIFYMSVLAAYLEAVWPTEWGVKKPWYFLFTSAFWCPKKRKVNQGIVEKVDWGDAVEPVDHNLETQKENGKAMIVRGLVKKFDEKVAVDGLNLDIYEGQIFGLLGHNGAGKTTTISMLTGLIAPTEGEMSIHGNLLTQNLDKLRENLGVCPQHSVLFPDLTPLEHMALFCMFKGMSDKEKIKQLSLQKLSELELTHKKDTQAQNLSGGQKRKLQLALALIGDSPIVLLDEPTSGMDLTARRHMWDMLKNNKNGRIIILTTHYMEEADVLADRIAIMSQGKLRCCGSSLFLKSRYGVGYYLVMVRNQEAISNTKLIEDFVTSNVDGSKLLTDFHGEITFQLPSASSKQFEGFFTQLDKKFESFGLLSYSMSATTLEEVFLKVARGDHEIKNLGSQDSEESPLLEENKFILKEDREQGSLFLKHFKALLKKRVLSTIRDKKSLLFEICIPVCLIIMGLGLMLIPSILKDYSAYELKVSIYSDTQTFYTNADDAGYKYVDNISGVKAVKTQYNNLEDFSDYIFKQRDLAPKMVASYFFNEADDAAGKYDVAIFNDQKAIQSYPVAFAAISNQILKGSLGNDFNIKYYNHPLPITESMNKLTGSGDGFVGSLIFSLGFCFIPTGIVLFITKEREVSIKHQHMISGVSLSAYWLSNLLWDTVKHLVTSVIASLIVLAFQVDIYTDDDDDYGAIWVLIILGGISQATFAYALSFLFKSHSTAQVFTLISSFVLGSIFPSAVFVMFIFEDSREAGKVLAWILKVFPIFSFGWGILSIGSKDQFKVFMELDEAYNSFDINSAGGCMLLMGIMGVFYFCVVIVFELFESNPSCAQAVGMKKRRVKEKYEHDDDVDREAQLAKETDPSTVQVNVKKLSKSFKVQGKTFTAVNKVSFNVNPEECFALLGVNGAGKTTTFKMLTGESFSDAGNAFVGGFDVNKHLSKARTLIGYCPQFDALSDLLTGREHLELYAHIKGIPKDRVSEQVEYMLKNMDLAQYRDILAGTYSGGNKRKLSVAMALIGNPSVVFLDEPSAGMDPEARKKMWKILGRIKKQKSAVILTTHSMEEAEALCDRMTIMVRGRLKCIGTSTWIKNKFGDGFEIEIKVDPPPEDYVADFTKAFMGLPNSHLGISFDTLPEALRLINMAYLQACIQPVGTGAGIYNVLNVEGYISTTSFASWCLVENLGKHIENWFITEFSAVEIIEHYHLMFKFKVKKEHVKGIGTLFSAIESQKRDLRISDYSICMTSLEQIFNRFAKRAEFEEIERLQIHK